MGIGHAHSNPCNDQVMLMTNYVELLNVGHEQEPESEPTIAIFQLLENNALCSK